jgi:hypothetical protein
MYWDRPAKFNANRPSVSTPRRRPLRTASLFFVAAPCTLPFFGYLRVTGKWFVTEKALCQQPDPHPFESGADIVQRILKLYG